MSKWHFSTITIYNHKNHIMVCSCNYINLLIELAISSGMGEYGCTELDEFIPLDRIRGVQLWDWADKLDSVQLYLRNETSNPIELKLSLSVYESKKK
jgi:hypothetical protein